MALAVLAAVYLVVNLILNDTSDAEIDFATATCEDFDNGDLVGFTFSRATESKQLFDLHAAADRLVVTVILEAEPSGFETEDALVVAETMGGQAFERFKEYV